MLMEKPETKHLAVVLTRYVSGSAASMGGRTNVDTDNPYIVIDLTGLSDDLQLAAVYAATGFATDVIVQNGDVGTALLSDELWKLLGANSNPLAADYTMQMVKLIRSQGGIAGVTSQGMADMMALDGGKYGKGILPGQVHHADGGTGGPAGPGKAESHRGGDPDDYPVPPGRGAAVHWAQPCTYRNPRLPQGVRGYYHFSH